MALQTATNPQTGERLALIGGQWVPYTQSATNPETGEKAVLINGEWVVAGGTPQPAPAQPPAPQEESGFLRQTADVPVQIASGVATGIRLVADAFGADNPVSQNIRGVENYLQGLLSAQAKNDQQEIARIMQEAQDKGVTENVVAALKAFKTAPIDLIAQAVGTAAPTIAGGLAAAALRAPALLASTGVGAVMGAGTVKSSIYDEVKQTLTSLGASPEEAERRAVLAQEYGGENLDQILLGTVIGGAAGRFGIESTAAKALAKDIAGKTVGKAMITEAAPEAVQAAQEQVAQNIALQREGVETPTFRGAVGAGALEALAGAGVGGLGEVAARRFRPEPTPEEETKEEVKEEPEVTPPAELEAAPRAEGEPAPSRDLLLADIEEVVEPEDEAARAKFEETVKKVREGEEPAAAAPALELARTKVQESGKTAAPYIQNTINKNLPDQKITLGEASRIRDQLIEEGVIVKDEKGKFVAATPSRPAPEVTADEEVKGVPSADVEAVSEVKRGRRGKRVGLPVSGEPTVAAAAEPEGAVDTGVEAAADSATRSDIRTEPSATPLANEVVESPQEKYESLQRRLEGLVNAKRVQPIVANRMRTTLTRQGNPITNPDTYGPVLNQVDEFVTKQEQYAESLEADNTAAGIDQRERNLKAQETNALNRAQNRIEQDKIAQSLRDRYDRGLADEEVLPKQARRIRDALEGNDIKSVTQMLVEPASAVDTYPKRAEKFRPLFTAVARKLNTIDFSNVKVVTEATPGANLDVFKRLKDEFKTAEYDPADNTLYIRRDKVFSNTIMHELIHAGTVQTIRQYELDKSKLTPDQRLGVARLMGIYDFAQVQESDVSLVREFPAAFENVYEFLAYGLTNPQFQARLARMEIPMPVGRKNMWTEFVKAIAKLFDIKFKSEDSVSALDELGQAFSEVLAAPTKEGITGVSPLAERKKAGKEPRPEIDGYEETRRKYNEIRGNKLTVKGLLKDRFSQKNIEELVEKYQDRQRYLLRLQTDLDRAGLAVWTSAAQKGNTIAAANDESAGRYENNEKALAPLMIEMNKAVSAYAAKKGISADEAFIQLGTYFTAEANQVRRLTNYWKEKPLKTKPTIRLKGSDKLISYAQYRDMLIDSVLTDQALDDQTREAIHNKLLQLAGIEIGPDGKPRKSADADKYADPLGASYGQFDKMGEARKPGKRPLDFEDPYYDIIKDWGYAKNEQYIGDMERDMVKNGIEIRAVKKAMEALDKLTMKFNEEATHLTQPAKNLIKLYGWEDKYVPLMGKVKSESASRDQFIYMNTVPNEILPGFRGRETAPDNPLLMTMINAGKSAARAARADIVPTLVNLMKPHPVSGKTYVKGELMGVIKFKDRYKGEINFDEADGKGGKKWVGQNKFYNYLKNGDIEVWRVDDEKMVQSLRPDWEPSKGIIEGAKNVARTVTSWIGQGHTRYQLKFAIYDFPRNLFANAGALAAEMGGANASKYIASVGHEVFLRGRIPQVWRIANAHFNGDWDAIKKIGGYNAKTGEWKDTFTRDAYDYLQRGGKISIVRSWQTRSQLEQLIDVANKSDIRKNAEGFKAALDRVFDLWLDGFELVARVQAFRVAKSYGKNTRKMTEAEAEQYGVYFAKNLANFEKRALNDLPAALYAFWPPSATGAVRAIDAITPAVRLTLPQFMGGTTVEKVLEELPEDIKNDPQAREAYAKRYLQLKRNGQGAIGFYAGTGFILYMMALSLGTSVKELFDDEENPSNPVQDDSKELWVRNIRIPLGWLDLPTLKDRYFQIPWGFGMGAFAAIGAQVAAVVTNGQTKSEFVGNVATIGVDSFLPLPFARYNPFDSPFNWFMSSVLPTALRPIFELGVNMSGLGQTIYRSYYNRFGPAFAGSENVEEMYRDIAKGIREASLGKYQPDPNEVRYFLTSYVDGAAALLSDVYNLWLTFGTGEKDFDPKTDLIVLDNFIGNKISPSFSKFEKANKDLEEFKKRYDSFINDPDQNKVRRFLEAYPDAPGIVGIYNKQISGMRQFRDATVLGEIYAETPQERKNYKKEMNKIRDVYMDQVVALHEAYKDKID